MHWCQSYPWSCKQLVGCPLSESRPCADFCYRLQLGLEGLWRVVSCYGLYCCHSDLDMGVWGIRHAPWPGHSWSSPCPKIQLKVVIGQAGYPAMTCSIQLGHGQDIPQGIVVSVDIKGWPIEVFLKFFDYSPFEGEKFQFVGRVLRFQPLVRLLLA